MISRRIIPGSHKCNEEGVSIEGIVVRVLQPVYLFTKINFTNPFALNLAGTSHQYVNMGTGINLANASFTVTAWAKRSTTAGKQWVIGYGTNRTAKALVLGFRDNDHVTCAFFNDDVDTVDGVNSDGVFASGKFADTNWHHLACTYDLATRKRVVYVDGIGWQYNNSVAIQANGTFNIGRVPWGEGYFSGNIDDVRVYNRALSTKEIEWLARATRKAHARQVALRNMLSPRQ